MGIVIVNMNAYTWEAVDFTMDWGTGITQDVTQVPYNEVYDWSKHGTAIIMVGVSRINEMDSKEEYSNQAADEILEAIVDVSVGHALENITKTKCNAPETFAEMVTTGAKWSRDLLDRAVKRSDKRPSLGWEPPRAR
jgi:hypothetical protein